MPPFRRITPEQKDRIAYLLKTTDLSMKMIGVRIGVGEGAVSDVNTESGIRPIKKKEKGRGACF